MSKKIIVGLIIFLMVVVMFADFKVNGVKVFEGFFRQLETDSLRELQHGGINYNSQGPSADIEVNDILIDINREIDTIYINNPIGSIDITGEERDDIALSYKITVYAESLELAESLVEKLEIISEEKDNKLVFNLVDVEIPKGVYGIKRDYHLLVPENLFLNIENKYGSLEVSNITNAVLLRNSYDEMNVNNVDGIAELYARYGDVYVKDVGKLKLESGYNSVDISRVGGDLELEQDYGQTRVSDIRGYAILDSSYGSLYFDGISGNIELNSKYTQVRGSDFKGKFTGKINYGQLQLSDISNDVEVDARYTGLEIDLSKDMNNYQLYCETEYGEINTNLPFQVEEKNNNTKILEGNEGTEDIKINLVSDHSEIDIYK